MIIFFIDRVFIFKHVDIEQKILSINFRFKLDNQVLLKSDILFPITLTSPRKTPSLPINRSII